jgi:hypothetical protein
MPVALDHLWRPRCFGGDLKTQYITKNPMLLSRSETVKLLLLG